MQITIHACAGLPGVAETSATVSGDVLTVDGVAYDLSAVPDDGEATPTGNHPFVGPIKRVGTELRLGLRFVYSTETAATTQPPAAPVLIVSNGPLPDPITRKS